MSALTEVAERGACATPLTQAIRSAPLVPADATAQLACAIERLRQSDVAQTIAGLKTLQAALPGERIAQALREALLHAGAPTVSVDMALRLGAFLRGALPALGPAVPPAARRASHQFVNVVGTSWVRSFGGNTAFFPLFIGMGPTTLLLTEQAAAVTRNKVAENLKRCDTTRPTLLMLGSDPYYHEVNFLRTRATTSSGASADDLAMMDQVAERHRAILLDARTIVSARVFLVGCTPPRSELGVQLSRHLNARLRAVCKGTGVEFLDWWDVLADPATQQLKAEYAADAYPGDAHFRIEATALFIDLLKRVGVLGPDIPATCGYTWSHVFDCEVSRPEPTRIWCEPSISPNNAVRSHRVAASFLEQKVADIVASMAIAQPAGPIGMVNVRDGFLPVALPACLHDGCIAGTDGEDNLHAAQMVLDFYGRPDVRLLPCGPALWAELGRRRLARLVLVIGPDDVAGDEARCNAVLRWSGHTGPVLIATPFAERLGAIDLGGRGMVGRIALGNRHLPPVWHNYVLAIAR